MTYKIDLLGIEIECDMPSDVAEIIRLTRPCKNCGDWIGNGVGRLCRQCFRARRWLAAKRKQVNAEVAK